MLVQDGEERITQAADGFVAKRHPRTFAGVDRAGRTLLVTVDGRSVDDLGLTIPETADVARSLGIVDARNPTLPDGGPRGATPPGGTPPRLSPSDLRGCALPYQRRGPRGPPC